MSADRDREELRRLAALARLQILDTPGEETFDRITRLAANLFAVPLAAITFVDQGREWYKSQFGFEVGEIPREYSFCNATIQSGRVTVIPDALADPRFAETALVAGPPHLRFYAGAPLIAREGATIGMIGIGDRQPRSGLSTTQSNLLRDLAAMTVDVVEQRQLNAALDQERRMLREQRRLSELIIEGSVEGIFAVDRELRCTLWNQAMADLASLSAAKVLGQDILAINWPLRSERAAQALRSALAGKPVALRDEAYLLASGEERFFAAHFSPLQDADGKLVGAIGFVRDTTARHELEDRLRQTQKLDAIGQLTGTVAHDFNNLLTVIIGNSERALSRVQGDSRLRGMIEDIGAAGQRGEKLTQQLLAFARRQRLDPQAVDVNALVSRMSDMLRRTLPATIDLRLDLWPRLPHAAVDPHQLEVALLNLALNARAAMPKGGTLTFKTRSHRLGHTEIGPEAVASPGRFVMVAVRDTGTGMTAQVKRRAFEPFFTTKARGQGTGLGLSQVYGFIMQSLGHIRIESRRGRGSTVEIYLPVMTAAAERGTDPTVTGEASGNRGTVLVVEDSDDVRGFASSVLQEHGFGTVQAGDAEEALRRLSDEPHIDLVFSDVVMPGRHNGLELARELRRTKPRLPVILTTGYSESLHEIEREGFPLLLKPYRPRQLVEITEGALAAKHPSG